MRAFIFLFLLCLPITAALSCQLPDEVIVGNQVRGRNPRIELADPPSLPQEHLAIKDGLSDYLNLEKHSRYMDTALMALQTTLYVGLSIANSFYTLSSPLKMLNPIFLYGTIASTLNMAARWTNWFYNVKSPEKFAYGSPSKDIYHLKKLALFSDVSYLTLFVAPATISAQEEPYPLSPIMAVIAGSFSLWTIYNAKVLCYGF